jgi:O-antigen/teichoic acid export membrane protein
MILKKSAPFALLVLMMTFYYRIDSVMLERMLPNGSEQSGIYAMGFRFLMHPTILLTYLQCYFYRFLAE